MNETARREFLRMVASYQDRGDPTGWFDKVYRDAQGDIREIVWADLVPNPHLVSWLEEHPIPDKSLRAVIVGCGVGDDAEALSAHGYRIVAFDISPTAIDMCRKRYPDSSVDYRVADLFDYPRNWTRGFDLVFECNTIQALPGEFRARALNAIADMVAPGGTVLVSCRSRRAGEKEDEFPLPLDRAEIDGFVRAGLSEDAFEAYDDNQDPPIPHFFACYSRPVECEHEIWKIPAACLGTVPSSGCRRDFAAENCIAPVPVWASFASLVRLALPSLRPRISK